MFTIRVYDWAPNGTNDIEVINETTGDIEYFQEALFGVDVNKYNPVCFDDNTCYCELSPKQCLSFVAASPVDNGSYIAGILRDALKG